MRWLIAIIVFSCQLAWADWVTNSTMPTAVDAGISVSGASYEYLGALAVLSNDTTHVFLGFRDNLDGVDPYQIWDVDLTSNTSKLVNASLGFPMQKAVGLTSPGGNTNIMVFTSGLPESWIFTYDPLSGETNLYAGSERSFQSSCLSSDGQMFLGTYYLGKAISYDPVTKTTHNWGKLDPEVADSDDWTYTYSIGVNEDYIYGGMRNTAHSPNWEYLTITRRSDTNNVVWWKDGGSNQTLTVFKGLAGEYYAKQITNATTRWWILTNETPVLIPSPPSYNPCPSAVNYEPSTWSSSAGWDVEFVPSVYSISGSDPYASIRYKRTTNSTWSDTLIMTNDWITAPAKVILVKPWSGGKLFWMSDGYGPIGTFTPHGLTESPGIYKYISGYDVLVDSYSEVYLSGYYQATLLWNPNLAWTIEPFLSDYKTPTINPHSIHQGLGIYDTYLAKGSDGKIYIAVDHVRTSTGGELAWYNPADGTSESNRLDLVAYQVDDLKPAVGATKMVYLSTTNLIVFDTATFTIDTNMNVTGNSALDKIVEYSNGNLFGVDNLGTNIFAFTINGTLIYSNNIPAKAWGTDFAASYKHRLTLGPDNFIWLCAGNKLYRINPADGTYVDVLATPADLNIMFNNGDAYLYGGTTIYELNDLLLSTSVLRVGNLISAPK